MITSSVQRWRGGRASYKPAGELFDPSSFEVALIPGDAAARGFVVANHYSASYPAARYRVGLYRIGGGGPRVNLARSTPENLVGVAVFSQPVNNLSFRPLPGGQDVNVELGRFVLLDDDDVGGNAETWLLARCFELLRREGIEGVISFSDPCPREDASGARVFPGHVGIIYQAHNACFLGRARADKLRLLPDGRVLHNRSLAKVKARAKGWEYVVRDLVGHGAIAPARDSVSGLRAWLEEWVPRITRRVLHPGNLKYAWGLDRATRRALPASLPYVKLASVLS